MATATITDIGTLIERTPGYNGGKATMAGCGASVPDLPGCVAVAESSTEVEVLIREAIKFHIERPRLEGQPVPPAVTEAEYVEIAV